jgi:hypothetical protein
METKKNTANLYAILKNPETGDFEILEAKKQKELKNILDSYSNFEIVKIIKGHELKVETKSVFQFSK